MPSVLPDSLAQDAEQEQGHVKPTGRGESLLQLDRDHLRDSLTGGRSPHAVASAGTSGSGGPLPHKDRIQSSFGAFDVSGIQSFTGPKPSAANDALGSNGYATNNRVAFAGTPDLHTTAHEAAHVVQQQGGLSLKSNMGEVGDAHEQHADAVADAVVRGESAEPLLAEYGAPGGGSGGAGSGLQLDARGQRLAALGLDGVDGDHLLGTEGEEESVSWADVARPAATLEGIALMSDSAISRYPDAPGGPQARPILQKAFGSNWFFAKDVLVQGKWPAAVQRAIPTEVREDQSRGKFPINDAATREKLMWKLLALREWETNSILDALRERYKALPAARGLSDKDVLKGGSAGSTSLTSDIDVNLKGRFNMEAVADFNTFFRERGWAHEAGIVYDVNVYCVDNMHGFKVDDDKTMSIGQEPNVPAGLDTDEIDGRNQDIAAYVKLIRFMTHSGDYRGNARWQAYRASLGCGEDVDVVDRPAKLNGNLLVAEARYDTWREALIRMKAKLREDGVAAEDTLRTLTSAQDAQHKTDDALDMQASNRLYEEKIEKLKELRATLEELAADESADEAVISATAIELRQVILEAGMFANEAMVTRGASNFVVYGTQVAGDVGAEQIEMTEQQFYQAFTEQLADTIKEFGHYDTLGAGLLKGGKYLMRMTLAADQLSGVTQGAIPFMAQLRSLGDYAMAAKGMDDPSQEDKQTALGTVVNRLVGTQIDDLEDVNGFIDKVVMPFGTGVTNAYQLAKAREESGSVAARGGEIKQGQVKGAGQDAALEDLQGFI